MKHPHIQKCRGTAVWFSSSSTHSTDKRRHCKTSPENTMHAWAFLIAQQEPRAATTEGKLHFQLEGQPSSLFEVETGLAQCYQMHHLNKGEELSSLTASLPHISPAQIKLTPASYLFMMVLLPCSLGCCQNNSETMLLRAMPHGLGA